MNEDELTHFGVKGMRWGVRNTNKLTPNDIRKSRKTADKYDKTASKLEDKHPLGSSKAMEARRKAEILRASANASEKRLKDMDEAVAKLKEASKKANENPGDEDAAVEAYRAELAYKKAAGIKYPLIRFKKKGETDAEHDERFQKEEESFVRAVAKERQKAGPLTDAEQKALKSSDKHEREAAERRKYAKEEIAYEIGLIKERAARDPSYTKDKQDRDEAATNKYWDHDLNATAETIKKENRTLTLFVVGSVLAYAGANMIQNYVVNKQLENLASKAGSILLKDL